MTVRLIDPETGDIVTRGVQFTTGQTEIAQTIATRLKLFKGEYFRDITDGTPWFQSILGKGGTFAQRDAYIKNRVIQTEGVAQLVQYDADFDQNSRAYPINMQVLTDYGIEQLRIEGGVV